MEGALRVTKAQEMGSVITKSAHGILESGQETEDEIWILVSCVDLLPAVVSKRGNGLEIPQLSFICLSWGVCVLELNSFSSS